MNQKLKIGIVGMGNVGIHFLQRLIELGHNQLTVYSRSGNTIPNLVAPKEVQFTNDFKEFIDFDLVFCAVNDNNMVEMVRLVSK
ncbi:NAD(P)-binding domain-containing protein, partial [Fluviicola sp.]|uniref:NAD(P)-binding domain-containing protein n=1 Tax=Fluviicola sp. TaxID=1917219 RepID=UPI002625534D